ncbi:enoyl-CoA hydratase EchA19-like [Ptychodera flava]|uniref:enoyl-CoA hydratase EchA19-like n=1 Tax=Ptychodera flava TaxID=63121 RepID=UPI00396A4280
MSRWMARTFMNFVPRSQCAWRPRAMHTSANEEQTVVTEKRGKIFLIGINRPYARNAVNIETGVKLLEAFKQFDKDDDALVAVFHGKGGCFCGGFDLKQLASGASFKGSEKDIGYAPMGPSKSTFSKPIIGAIDGYAVAGGLELALICDMRVVEESAIMGVFCRRFGVPLIDGGTVRLQKLIGLSRALDVILTGRPVKAQEALQFGLANRVVPDGTCLDEAIKLANEIAAFPQECMKADRRAAYYAAYDSNSFEDAMKYEHENGVPIIMKESVKGASRFASGVGRSGSFDAFKSKL